MLYPSLVMKIDTVPQKTQTQHPCHPVQVFMQILVTCKVLKLENINILIHFELWQIFFQITRRVC